MKDMFDLVVLHWRDSMGTVDDNVVFNNPFVQAYASKIGVLVS
jgi:hypothetical protein